MAKVGKPKLPESQQKVGIIVNAYYKRSDKEKLKKMGDEFDRAKARARILLYAELNKLLGYV
jgi:hypothetical protein